MTSRIRLAAFAAWLLPTVASADEPTPALEARLAKLQAEIDELKTTANAALDAAATTDTTQEPSFRVYGFMDVGLQKVWVHDDPILPTKATTFTLGNVNLYFDFHPNPDWSSLVEVRFTNYPTGTEQYGIPLVGQDFSRTNTTAQDPGNGEGYDTVRWGSIVLQRAYMQWQHDHRIGVRVGQFLTPYGIWNVDHGTPTLISLYRPKFQSNQMFPEAQLGVEAFGAFDDIPFDHWQLQYSAYVSNGRTPGVVALTDEKTFGGRLEVSTTVPRRMVFGLSAMHGRYVDQRRDLDALTGDTIRTTTIDEEEMGFGVDASLDEGPLRVRWEAALHIRDYQTGKRELSWVPGTYVADGYEADTYAIVAYRIPHTKVEPYLYGELYRWPTPLGDLMTVGSLGANYYFTPSVQLKVQLLRSDWLGAKSPGFAADDDETFLASKLVMGF